MVTSRAFSDKKTGYIPTLYTFTAGAYSFSVTDFGATLVSFIGPDKTGAPTDVVLGFDDYTPYTDKGNYFGAIIGRHAGRIGGGAFDIDGKTYTVSVNDNGNSLHGGINGFNKKRFYVEYIDGSGIVLSYSSPDGEEGFPGIVDLAVRYSLSEDGVLSIEYTAQTSKDTVVNFTNHAYFNPSGSGEENANNDLMLTVCADGFCECDENCLATGTVIPVEGTPFDFREPKRVGDVLKSGYEPLKNGKGIDHNFCLKEGFKEAARLYSPKTGITVVCLTDRPGIQIYSGNFMEDMTGKNGARYGYRGAVCMEAQGYPNATSCKNFPTPILRQGEAYRQLTQYKIETV